MTEHQMIWAKASGEALSYRRMYALAVEIAGSDAASDELRRLAKKVVRALGDVIELAIADAHILRKARRRFEKFAKALAHAEPPIVIAA